MNFDFTHVLSRVRVEVSSDEFTDAELQGLKLTLNGFQLNGNAVLSSGTVTATGGATPLTPHTDTDGAVYSALVMPGQTIASRSGVVSIVLTDYPDRTFTGTLDTSLTFVPGKTNVIKLTLTKTRVILTATLEEWEDGDTGNVNID